MPIGLSPIPSGVSGRALEGVGASTREGPESGHWGLATVEAEHELSQVDGEVFRSNAMVGSGQTGLEVGKTPMDSGQDIPWVARVSLDLGLMVVAHGSRRLVAGEPIRNDGASLDDIGLDKSCQPLLGGCRDHGKLDPSGALSPDFYGTRTQDLVGCPTSSLSMLGATDVMKRAFSRVAPPSVKRRTRSRDARTSRIERSRPPTMGIGGARSASEAGRWRPAPGEGGRRWRSGGLGRAMPDRPAEAVPALESRRRQRGGVPGNSGVATHDQRDEGLNGSWAAGLEGQGQPLRRRQHRFDDEDAPGPTSGTAGDVLARQP